MNSRDAFIAGKIGMWLAGSWSFTGLNDAKIQCNVIPMVSLFKVPSVWTQSHVYTFPKPEVPEAGSEGRSEAWRRMDPPRYAIRNHSRDA